MKKLKLQAVALSALIALGACAQTDDEDGALDGDTTALAGDTAPSAPVEPVVTNLDEVDDSGIEGEATATHSSSEVTVSILLKDGAKADVTYPAHIHTGTCEAGGPVAVELAPVQNLQSSKTVSLTSLPANQSAFVQVHDPAGKAVACGDMQGHDDGRMGNDTTRRATTAY